MHVSISTHGSVEKAAARLGGIPSDIRRAKAAASRGLVKYVEREIARALSAATGAPQKTFKATKGQSGARAKSRVFWDIGKTGTLQIWVGTDPLPLHYIGKVTWRRYIGKGSRPKNRPKAAGKGLGARVGRYGVVPGSFGFMSGNTMLAAARQGSEPDARVDVLKESIHAEAESALQRILPSIEQRWEFEVERALRAQLAREGFYASNISELAL